MLIKTLFNTKTKVKNSQMGTCSNAADVIEFCPETTNSLDDSKEPCQFTISLEDDNITPRYAEKDLLTAKMVYVCSICIRQYDLVEDLRGHMVEYHNCYPIKGQRSKTNEVPLDSTINSCEIDNRTQDTQIQYTYMNKLQITGQVKINKSIELRPVPFKDFRLILQSKMTLRCPVTFSCTYKFENNAKTDMHTKCHVNSSERKFICFVCSLESKNWRCCSEHLWKVHQIDVDLLHCPICEFTAHASVLVWRHMRFHKKWRFRVLHSMRAVQQNRKQKLNETKPLPPSQKNKYYSEKICEICNRKFVNGKTLSKHVKTVHNKIKPFICNVCGQKTARKASLIIHMRQHTGEKPLQCKSCKFSTRDPSVLYKHQQRHEKMGKFRCSACDYFCIQTNAYKRHIRLNHPDIYKTIACDQCDYVTITAERLKTHKEDHRKGLILNYEDSLDARGFKNPLKILDKNNEFSVDCFMPLESIDSLLHEPTVDTGGVTIPAPPSEDTQFPSYLNL